ncbi:RING-H2 finger protein ATL16 [Heracleum sosnowskyi]|uniref:RING-type E3 ubiquitin transferase n=1 Tax=Heracleum sosnowskyi TaxID=360622 RepID=A0AAD8N7V1_9APIA|nr:RING-H2 finger protein ATL16 [Heracleum sosnowskyi]
MNHVQFHNHESHIKSHYSFTTHALVSIKNQHNSTYQTSLPSSGNGFPILALGVLGIMVTAFLLVGYYIFVNKCCLNWQQIDPLSRFSVAQARRNEELLMAYSPSWQSRGLDDFLIREIPSFQYSKSEGEGMSLYKCVVCLNEFQEQDTVKLLPSCKHGFHLDCIDIWLQSNDNCPLCRLSISGATRYPIDRIVAPTSSPQDPQPFLTRGLVGSDQNFVVIELSGEQNRNESRIHYHSPGKVQQKAVKLKPRKFHHASIMGDECMNIRENDDQFSVQPIRRSFSMDSAADRLIYLSVEEITRQNTHQTEVRNNEESSSRVRRPFFSFGHVRGSRSTVLPI